MTLTPSQSVRLFRGPSPRAPQSTTPRGATRSFRLRRFRGLFCIAASLYVESSGSLRLTNWLPVPPNRQYIERQSTESILMGNTIIETFEGPSNRRAQAPVYYPDGRQRAGRRPARGCPQSCQRTVRSR